MTGSKQSSFKQIQFHSACIMGLLLLSGCGGSGSSSSGTGGGTGGGTSGSAATSVFLVQQPSPGTNSVLQFTLGTSGTLSPTATITPAGASKVTAVATDSTGLLYVSVIVGGVNQIVVYGAGSAGMAPVRTILPSGGSFDTIGALATDASGQLYVMSSASKVAVFSATATGAATPTRLITGSNTQLGSLYGLAVDSTGSNIYVSTTMGSGQGLVLAFGSTATGNVAPDRTITIVMNQYYGIGTDSAGNLYVALDPFLGVQGEYIAEYSPTASGVATPIKTITPTLNAYLGGIRVDPAGSVYSVAIVGLGNNKTVATLIEFPSTATGSVAPALQFTSSAWTTAGSELALK